MSLILGLALIGSASATIADPVIGVWSNPKGSLQVRTRRCGDRLCATVVSASAKAQAKAAAAGVPALIGTEIFSNYRPVGEGDWVGTLYIPDKGKRVSSKLEANSGRSVKVSGCLIGRILCKTQTWTRVEQSARR